MSKRWYIAPIIGDGTEGNFYRLKLPAGVNYSAVIPSNADGTPKFTFGLAIVAAADHTALLNDPELDAIPNSNVDKTMSVAERGAVILRLAARGISTTRVATEASPREIVRLVGRHLEGEGWDERRLDCADVSA